MPTAQWKPDPELIQRLLREPQRFEFCQAMRLLAAWQRSDGERDVPPLRFRGSTSLAFPAAEIEALNRADDGHLELTTAFMSMLGVGGVLPLHYTERLAGLAARPARESGEGGAAQAFVDIFSSHAPPQFFKAWSAYRPEALSEGWFRRMLLAFAGAADGDDVQAFHASRLRRPAVSAASAAHMLSAHFGIPIRIEQFAGNWEVLGADMRNSLGAANSVLGADLALGTRLWRRDQRIILHAGPLALEDFNRFLPGSDGALALQAMTSKLPLGALSCEIRLTLRAQQVHGLRLEACSSLGFDTFLPAKSPVEDRSEVRYLLGG